MKKLRNVLSIAIVFVFAFIFNFNTAKAEVACPVGLVCTPIGQSLQSKPVEIQPIYGDASTCIKLYTNLSVSSKDTESVKKLQNFLISNKFLVGTANGVFDTVTLNAVKSFQESRGISPTGFVGSLTRKEINESCTKSGDNPYISIFYPNGGERYKLGKDYLVTWYSSFESKNVKVYLDYYPSSDNSVNKFISPAVSTKVGLNSFTIPSNAVDVSGQFKVKVCDENSSASTKCDVSNSTFAIEPFNSTEVSGQLQLKANTIGFSKNSDKYQVNLTFIGGSTVSQIRKWKLNLPCKVDTLTITNTSSNACGISEVSNNSSYGNIENKEYYFINKSGVNQTIEATLIAYDSNNVLLGKSMVPLVIPPVTAYSATPTPSPINFTNSTISSIYILPSYDDRAGIWDKFTSGIGNANRTSADWNWFLSLNVPTTHTDISSITITNDASNEGWSTSVANVFGRAPYPLVVVDSNGNQLNTGYGQNISIPQGSSGTYSYKLYGQMETTKYYGGTLTIKFTDGSTVTAKVSPSNVTPITPITNNTSSTESKKPFISSVKSLAGEEMVVYAGERFSIQGKNLLTYASGNTNIYLGGQKVYASQISNDLAWVVAPKLSAGVYYLYVSNENGSSDYVKVNIRSSKAVTDQVVTTGSSAITKIVKNVKIVNKTTGKAMTAGDTLLKNQIYTVSWDAENLNMDSKFSLVLQSVNGSSVYGLIKTGVLDYSARSYSWTIDTTVPELTEMYVSVQLNTGEKANSSIFKVSPSTTVASEGFKNVYPITGYPGTKVTLQLNNPKGLVLKQDDFAFGQYGFVNFTNSNNEVVTFTVPWDALVGPYDIVWFGNETHVIKFNVMSPANTSAAIDWYYQISR